MTSKDYCVLSGALFSSKPKRNLLFYLPRSRLSGEIRKSHMACTADGKSVDRMAVRGCRSRPCARWWGGGWAQHQASGQGVCIKPCVPLVEGERDHLLHRIVLRIKRDTTTKRCSMWGAAPGNRGDWEGRGWASSVVAPTLPSAG